MRLRSEIASLRRTPSADARNDDIHKLWRQRKYNAQQSLRASAKQSRSYNGKIQNNFILLNILP